MAPKRAAKRIPSPPSSSAEDDGSSSSEGEQQPPPKKKLVVTTLPLTPKPKPAPPSPSSSEDDEEGDDEEEKDAGGDEKKAESSAAEDDEEEEESDSDADAKKEQPSDGKKHEKQQPPPPPPPPPPAQPSPESSDSGSSDGSDSEKPISARRPPRGADPSIKPVSSRPMDEPKPPKPRVAGPSSPASSKAKPRAAEAPPEKDGGSEKKRKMFERFWSEDDEVRILRGILDYHTRKRTNPSSALDMDAVHDYLRTSLGSEFSKSQLADKIRRLKKKYETASARAKNGTTPNFARPQEHTVYKLSQKIWGPKENNDANGEVASDNESEDKDNHVPAPSPRKRRAGSVAPAAVVADDEEGEASYPLLMDTLTHMGNMKMSVFAAKRALSSVECSKVAAMEEKFRKHRVAEMKHHVQWLELMKETVKLVMEGLNKSG